MLIEPVPTGPRSPIRRALQLVAIAAPVVLLAGVVAAGALGQRSEPFPEAGVASPGAPALASPPAARIPVATTPAAEAAAPAFPSRVAGQAVRSVADTLAARRNDALGGIVAVAGHLTIGELGVECAARYSGQYGALCPRTAVLTDSRTRPDQSSTGGGAGLGAVGPHLHPTIPTAVRLPRLVVGTLRGDRSPVPVIVLGRFTAPDPGPCSGATRSCEEPFTIERIAWVDAP